MIESIPAKDFGIYLSGPLPRNSIKTGNMWEPDVEYAKAPTPKQIIQRCGTKVEIEPEVFNNSPINNQKLAFLTEVFLSYISDYDGPHLGHSITFSEKEFLNFLTRVNSNRSDLNRSAAELYAELDALTQEPLLETIAQTAQMALRSTERIYQSPYEDLPVDDRRIVLKEEPKRRVIFPLSKLKLHLIYSEHSACNDCKGINKSLVSLLAKRMNDLFPNRQVFRLNELVS
jgi:hypothetical protein